MSGGDWWGDYGDDDSDSQYNPAQTAATQNQLDPNTTYEPPGTASPIDQYNYVPDPNAPGGYQQYAPGIAAPEGAQSFSNTSGQYPNDQSMANALANQQAYVQPTVDINGFANMSQQDQSTWNSQYGSSAAPYQWGLQNGQYTMPGGTEGFLNLPADQQNTWYGTYGADAPMVWAQQSQQNNAAGGIGQSNTIGQMMQAFLGNYPSYMGGGTVAPSTWGQANPQTGQGAGWGTIGAGTAGQQYGYGVPGFGQDPIRINDQYLQIFQNPELMKQLMPGYIPGSGTYNQYRLDQGGLIGNIMGVPTNLRYGQGGTGDPTTGLETQTPQQIVNGPKLFNSTRTSNWGQGDQAGTGLDYIATLFLRPDTPSGINTAAWSAPPQMWQGLGQQIAQGNIQPTKEGWAVLAQRGLTPQSIGGQAPAQAQQAGYTGGAGAAGGGQGPMGAGTQAFNYQAAYLDYLTAMMNNVQIPGVKNQNQQFQDELAFNQAKQKWMEQYQQQVFGEGQRQFDVNTGLQQGQLTGMYNGQETLGKQQLNQQTSLNYLQLLAGLRGPGDIFQYMKVLNGTPGGIRDIVNAAAGAYRMPATGGASVGGYSNGSDLGTLLDQMNNPNYGAEGQNLNLPPPNQLNAQALLRMTPSQQQMLLGAYESAGYRPEDVQAIFRNSMPRYANQGGAGRVGLF
jgi:hypothetical protein